MSEHDQIAVEHEIQMAEFSKEVRYAKKSGGITYLEALVEVCQRYELDEENVKNLLSPDLLSEIHEEAKKLRLVKATGESLPIEE